MGAEMPDWMLETLGWVGSAVLVLSILQTTLVRLRWLGLCAAVLLVIYNLLVASWPNLGLNLAVAVIHAFYLVRARLQRGVRTPIDDEPAPQVVRD